ncbi:D-aminoacylase [Alteromonas sp. 14N.309.X.WAT.G.H12]|uniref:N-acyl-D-amino-acid deacylase family protein n=1 Tax=Alteromonas sp. 14N.309.X.WAT.G.H12 TaxID=3120824 RepID=UPI002FD6DE8D
MNKCFFYRLGMPLLILLSANSVGQTYDVIIKNGLVMDGTGAKGVNQSIAIAQGSIVAMGDLSDVSAKQVIDAKNRIVAPGFIDLHSHAEGTVSTQPHLDNLVQQGITTILGGNCGFSPVDMADYFDAISQAPIGPNMGLLIGHNDIRKAVMGEKNAKANSEELAAMKVLVKNAMAEGAFGLSTGLKYVPGVYSNFDEVRELAAVSATYGGFFSSHMRDEGGQIREALAEVIAVAKSTGIPVHISHHKVVGQYNWGVSQQTLAMIQKARNEHLDVTLDQYPYTASSTRFSILFPSWSLAGGQEELIKRLADTAQRKKIKAGIIKNIEEDRGGGDASRLQIAHFAAHPQWNGMTFAQILALQRREPSVENAAELAMEIQSQGGAQGIFHAIAEQDVVAIMGYPYTSIATDAVGVTFGQGNPHPRSYGTFPKVLGEYVREKGVLSLPQAIYKMTGLPASRMQLSHRGKLAVGYAADIVIFDPQTVIDKATYVDPHHYANGIDYVLVNGTIAKTPTGMTGNSAGRILLHQVNSR